MVFECSIIDLKILGLEKFVFEVMLHESCSMTHVRSLRIKGVQTQISFHQFIHNGRYEKDVSMYQNEFFTKKSA